MNGLIRPLWLCLLLCLESALCSAQAFDEVPAGSLPPFPHADLLPKRETGALRFLEQHPQFDGRGVTVAIFDTGVDPGAPGLTVTSDGRPKIVDIVDATGSGDVRMETVRKAVDGQLEGLSGRTLTIDPDWKNPTGEYRVGLKRGFELFPGELVSRLKRERRREWDRRQTKRLAQLTEQIHQWDEKHPRPTSEELNERKELVARRDVLEAAQKQYDDPGPIYDCVVFHDGEQWWAVIDTDEDGDLANEQRLTDYHEFLQFASFGEQSQLNYSVNIYDEGERLSIVTLSGDHGTHVAGIVGACYPDNPDRNGVAPGVQIVSVKIGDTRLDSMETGRALVRGLRTVLDRNCDLINMSYGEPSSTPNEGRLVELLSEVVNEHGVIFVASAGNAGPALSTVGAPGGSTEAILGIGAYVSPEMMQAEYALRRPLEGMPFTWTSRGPTTDGARGVDLFAPGAAIAPVPNYNLQPSLRMNGTSMASPNACGNIALLLSAMKAEEREYSPALVRRALQNSAQLMPGVDRFAQGPGLLQVDHAYDWLSANAITPAERLAYDVRIGRDGTRGILLRELKETRRSLVTDVSIRPRFRENEQKEPLVDFEVPITLVSSEPWVETGRALLLTSRGNQFEVQVDATELPPGIHSATVDAYESDHRDRGPLFQIPITIIKPPSPQPQHAASAKLQAGSIVRGLASVPEGATWADITVHLAEADGPRRLLLHAVQLVPGQSFEEGESKQYVNIEPGGSYVHSLPVVSGRTIEIVLAQFWSSLGDSQVEWQVRFRGLVPDDAAVALSGDGEPTPVTVRSTVRRERCEPSGTLSIHRRLLRPDTSRLEPLISPRDLLPDEAPTSRLLLTYQFEHPSKSKTTIRIPQFDGLLYDAPLEGHQWILTDSNGQVIRTDDLYPESFDLEKGSYTLHVELRLADVAQLKKWSSPVVAIDRLLASSLELDFYSTRVAAAAGSGSFPATWLDPGESATLWMAGLTGRKLPGNVQAGDVLLGRMTFVESPSGLEGASSRPGGFPLQYVVPPEATDADSAPKAVDRKTTPVRERFRAQRLDLRLKQLSELDWTKDSKLIETILEQILEEFPDARRRLLVTRLHLLDNDDRKERLPEVIAAADAVIDSINQRRLRNRLNIPEDSSEKAEEQRRQAEKLKEILVDALYRKGRALAYQELPDVVAEHPIDDPEELDRQFDSNFQELSRWVDTTDSQYALLHIRRDRRHGAYGLALELLGKQIAAETTPRELLFKKRRDLYGELGWDDWQKYTNAWMLIRFPHQGRPLF